MREYKLYLPEYGVLEFLHTVFSSVINLRILYEFVEKGEVWHGALVDKMIYSKKTMLSHFTELVDLNVLEEEMKKDKEGRWCKVYTLNKSLRWIVDILEVEKVPTNRLKKTQEWKDSIRQRDNYTCQLCGITQKKNGRVLDIHHIDSNRENNSSDNLITLCSDCHGKARGKDCAKLKEMFRERNRTGLKR